MANMRYGIRFAASLLPLFLILTACATKRYEGPISGVASDAQRVMSTALARATKDLDFTSYKNRKVFLDVVTLTPRVGANSPEEKFIQSWLEEKLAQSGVKTVSSVRDADLRLVVLAKIFGVDRRRRDLILLYYSEKTMGQVHLHLTFYERATGRLLASQDIQGLAEYSEVFWLYIFGPFRSQR
jgi:hypothetical protein